MSPTRGSGETIVNSRNYETAGDPEPDLTGCFGAALSACTLKYGLHLGVMGCHRRLFDVNG
jgi:hypothetical protein